MGSEDARLAESERGVWVLVDQAQLYHAHPMLIERTSSIFSGGGNPFLPPKFWSPVMHHSKACVYAASASRLLERQRAPGESDVFTVHSFSGWGSYERFPRNRGALLFVIAWYADHVGSLLACEDRVGANARLLSSWHDPRAALLNVILLQR